VHKTKLNAHSMLRKKREKDNLEGFEGDKSAFLSQYSTLFIFRIWITSLN
jgi:hypothetical protein